MKTFLSFCLIVLSGLSAWGASPSYGNFFPGHFLSNNFTIYIAPGVTNGLIGEGAAEAIVRQIAPTNTVDGIDNHGFNTMPSIAGQTNIIHNTNQITIMFKRPFVENGTMSTNYIPLVSQSIPGVNLSYRVAEYGTNFVTISNSVAFAGGCIVNYLITLRNQ